MIADYNTFRAGAIRYWERRRIFYNLALVPFSLLSYLLGAALESTGDVEDWDFLYPLLLFTVSAIGANICYSFAYAAEFIWGNDNPSTEWLQSGRKACFVAGTVVSMLLGAIAGRDIATMHFQRETRQIQRDPSLQSERFSDPAGDTDPA